MKNYVIIVAGGTGSRMKSDIPKQFIELCGKPVIMHSIERFYSFDPNLTIIIVLPQHYFTYWTELCSRFDFKIPHNFIAGGYERFHSVKNALVTIHEDGIVFIHDSVRPMVSRKTIENTFLTALEKGNAIPFVPLKETIREITETGSQVADRSSFVNIQTPQCFRLSLIKDAYKTSFKPAFTDDASVLEANGGKIHLVEGNSENIKITDQTDLLIAETLIKRVLYT